MVKGIIYKHYRAEVLILLNRVRTATVLCREETLAGVLTYESYQAILGKYRNIVEMLKYVS